MIVTNYHTHNDLCDGKGKAEEYVEYAVAKGFSALGFSSHGPLPFDNPWTLSDATVPIYLAEIDRLKEVWKDKIQIYKGLEIDYIPGSQAPGDARWKALGLDYMIGAVHSSAGFDINPEYYCVDGPDDHLERLIEDVHGGSFEKLSEAYYSRIAELVRLGGFEFLGHLDLIKKRNRNGEFFSEKANWYRRHVLSALDAVATSGIIMEVNSGAISRGTLDEVYPSPWILKEALKREIPVMVNADAHSPEAIDCHFVESHKLLKDIGFTETWALLDGKWNALPLET